jgi:hypothetical protein
MFLRFAVTRRQGQFKLVLLHSYQKVRCCGGPVWNVASRLVHSPEVEKALFTLEGLDEIIMI